MIPQYTQPFNQQQQTQMLQQMLTNNSVPMKQNIVKVSGRPGAEAYQLAPDSDILLLDNTAPIVWLVQTDGAGYKTLTPYDIKEHKEVSQEDHFKTLEARLERLEGIVNGKSNNADAKRRPEQHNANGTRSNAQG